MILIDGALPQAVHDVEANIRRLGLDPRDIKFILSTEPHYDHASGLAALARDSGATVVASAWAAKSLTSGRPLPDDPQASMLENFPAVTRIRVVGDGERIRLGDITLDRPWVEINPAFPLANFGSCPLQHFTVTFDQENKLVRLEGPRKRITLGVTPAPLRLTNQPGNPAELALVPIG